MEGMSMRLPLLAVISSACLAACGGSATYTIGGTVSGLVGTGLVLRNNGGDDLVVSASGTFRFATTLATGAAYNVTVSTQPGNPAQTCVVSNGSGTVVSSNVGNIAVSCATVFSAATVNGAYLDVGYTAIGDRGTESGISYDGAGSYSGSQVVNVAGSISGAVPVSGTYTVDAVGAIAATGGTVTTDGAVSTDGGTLVWAQLTPGSTPSVHFGIRQGQSTFSNANVSGNYILVSHEQSGTAGNLLTITCDGAGNWTGTGSRNQAGTISSISISGTYTVAANGSMTFSPNGGTPLNGGVSVDGNTILLSQTTSSGAIPVTAVAIRQGQGNATNGSLLGQYAFVNYGGASNSVALLTLVADGAGNATGTTFVNNGGTVTNSAVSTTYTVAADGTVTIANGSATPLVGYLGADGSTIVAIDMQQGDLPVLTVGVGQ
jgi:hypothetical protein